MYQRCAKRAALPVPWVARIRLQGLADSCFDRRTERFGYRPEDIVMLTDDAQNPRQVPTRANMIAAMQWLVQGAQANDSLFFH